MMPRDRSDASSDPCHSQSSPPIHVEAVDTLENLPSLSPNALDAAIVVNSSTSPPSPTSPNLPPLPPAVSPPAVSPQLPSSPPLFSLSERVSKVISKGMIDRLLSGLVILSLFTFVAETLGLSATWQTDLHWIDTGILVAFAIEYLIRLTHAERKWDFIWSPLSAIDLLVISDLILAEMNLPFSTGLRGVQVLRLLRFVNVDIEQARLDQRDRVLIVRIVFTLIAIIFIFAGSIYQAEHAVNPLVFRTVFDAIYFSVVTMTTVGFGDITPISTAGRALTVLMILSGIALIPWQVGQLIEQLVRNSRQVYRVCPGCHHDRHDEDARFCKACGDRLPDFDA